MKNLFVAVIVILFGSVSGWCSEWDFDFENYLKLAEGGDAYSQACIAYAYYIGPKEINDNFSQDFEKAAYWYKKAAKQKSPFSQYRLGCMYLEGLGVPVNSKKAISWLKKAAKNGNLYAPYTLGDFYYKGQGDQKDFEQAYIWYSLASKKGSKYAKECRDEVAKKNSAKQIAEANKYIYKIQNMIDSKPQPKTFRFF